MSSPFAVILRDAVTTIPGAIGGAFAASDGEMVDSVAADDPDEWAILTAHYGVLLAHIQSALHTFHYGEAEWVLIDHTNFHVLVRAVAEGYFALMAIGGRAPLGAALEAMERAASALRQEMG
jgi:predicted regulator of Ras-like GTPase activity (Roadblock/LC7/MglB family)